MKPSVLQRLTCEGIYACMNCCSAKDIISLCVQKFAYYWTTFLEKLGNLLVKVMPFHIFNAVALISKATWWILGDSPTYSVLVPSLFCTGNVTVYFGL
jgi:hypothetical protein